MGFFDKFGSAIIGAGSSLLGNVFGAASNNSTNKANMRIAQMNNEWSEKMMQKQMDYNTQMWNAQNEYNDPSKQVERLKKAGINPALALSNISTGSAQSASSPSLPSPSGATMQPYQPDFSGVGNAVLSAYQLQGTLKQQDAQSRFLDTQSDWYSAKAMADISKAMAETRSHTAKTYYQNIQNSMAKDMMNADYINKIRQNQSMEVSIMNSIKQGVMMDKEISRYDERTNAQIADIVASTALKYAQGNMSKQELKNAIEQNKALKLSNKEKEAIFDYVVEKTKLDTWRFSASELPALGGYAIGQGIKKIGSWIGFGK